MKKSVLRFPNVFLGLFLFIISVSFSTVYAQSRGSVFALTNAKIVTVSGSAIDKGTIIIRDGLIQNVGAGISIPADAQVIDGTGLTVYPGFFDADSGVGIAAPQQIQGQGRGQGGGGFQIQTTQSATQPQSNSNYPVGLQPEISASDLIKSADASVDRQGQTVNSGYSLTGSLAFGALSCV